MLKSPGSIDNKKQQNPFYGTDRFYQRTKSNA